MSRLQRFRICSHVYLGRCPRLLHCAPLVLIKTPAGISLSQVCHCAPKGRGIKNGLIELKRANNVAPLWGTVTLHFVPRGKRDLQACPTRQAP